MCKSVLFKHALSKLEFDRSGWLYRNKTRWEQVSMSTALLHAVRSRHTLNV